MSKLFKESKPVPKPAPLPKSNRRKLWELQILILKGIEQIMASEQDLKNSLDNIQLALVFVFNKLSAQTQTIKDLSDALAAGSPVSQEQLDALEAEAQAIEDSLAPLVTDQAPEALVDPQ